MGDESDDDEDDGVDDEDKPAIKDNYPD